MKALTNYIYEAIKIGKSTSDISVYTCQPKSKTELEKVIEERIKKEGSNCDLNDIDTSEIADMSDLFYRSSFNGDISKWNVSKVEDMSGMFEFSSFDGDISNWDTSNVKTMNSMFFRAKFNGDISKWNVSNVDNMVNIFYGAMFDQDISNWTIDKDCKTEDMFKYCDIEEEHKPKSLQNK